MEKTTFEQIEIWKTIPNYEGYMASNLGRIKSVNRLSSSGRKIKGKILKTTTKQDGYVQVSLCKNGHDKHFFVHRLVMLAFVGECPEKMQVNHIDENKHNNCLSNLEYITPVDNCNFGTRNNRISLSSKHPKTKEHCEHISKARKGMIFSEDHKHNISVVKRKQCGVKVQCVETGEIFECILDAEKAVGLRRGSGISNACRNSAKKCGGYRWRYA